MLLNSAVTPSTPSAMIPQGSHAPTGERSYSTPHAPRVGVRFSSRLDTDAYAALLNSEGRYVAVPIYSDEQISLKKVSLVISDQCCCGPKRSPLSPPTPSAEPVILLTLDNTAERCANCKPLPRSVDWGVLLAMVERIAPSPIPARGEFGQPVAEHSAINTKALPPELAKLTPRELDILQQVGLGKSVKKIAETLNLAQSTVGNHKYRLMRKLGVKSSLELLRIAVRSGLVNV